MILPILLIVAFVVVVVGTVVFVYNASRLKQQATSVKTGTIEAIEAGNSLHRLLVNVPGYVLAHRDGLDVIIKKEEADQAGLPYEKLGFIARWLRGFGIWWVSIMYPVYRIKKFKITKRRAAKANPGTTKTSVLDQIETDPEPAEVDHLLWRIPRIIGLKEVETLDRFRVNIVVQCVFLVETPRIPMFDLDGKFFEVLEEAVSGAVNDWANSMTYVEFVAEDKGTKEQSSAFALALRGINDVIRTEVGIILTHAWISGFESAEDEEVLAATRAKELATLQGDARVEKSAKDLIAAQNDAIAKAAPVTALVTAYGGNHALANQHFVAESLGTKGVTTLVLGDALPVIGVNTAPAVNQPQTKAP